jgi:ankyrin repeat protein
LSGIASAQVSFSLSGAFKSKTLNVGKGINGELSLSVQTNGDQALAMGGVRGKEGDTVSFDSNGFTKTGGFWKGLTSGTYTILLKASRKKSMTSNADAGVNDQVWLARSQDGRTITTRGPGGPEIVPLILQVSERPREIREGSAILEVHGTIAWYEDGAFSGKENLLRISNDGIHFAAITDCLIKDGALIVASADGARYKISAFSYDFSATVESPEATEKVEPSSDINPLAGTPAKALGDDLFSAATSHDLPRVKALLAKGTDVNAKNANGATALFGASYYGNLDVVQALLAKGADINARSNGATALFVASQEGHFPVVQVLLAKGADVNANASDGRTALDAAKGGGHTDVVDLLVRSHAQMPATQPNALPEPQSATTALPKTEPSPIPRQPQSVINPTPGTLANGRGDDLFNATTNDNLPRVKALLAGGGDVNARTVDEVTALMLAVKEGHINVAIALIDADADLNAKDKYGNTALIYASNRGQLEAVRALLDAKAALEARDNDGNSALIDASGRGQLAVIQELLERGANVNAASNDGVTPLIAASYHGDRAVIQMLLSKGANVDAMTAKGVTALEAASQAGLADANALFSPSRSHSGGPVQTTDATSLKDAAVGPTTTSVTSTAQTRGRTSLAEGAQDQTASEAPVELNAYQSAMKQTDPVAKAAALEGFLDAYPQSVLYNSAIASLVGAYTGFGEDDKAVLADTRILQAYPNSLMALSYLVLIKKKQCVMNKVAQTCDDAAGLAQKALSTLKPANVPDHVWNLWTNVSYPVFHSAIASDDLISKQDVKAAITEYRIALMLYAPNATKAGTGLFDLIDLAEVYGRPETRDLNQELWFYSRAWSFIDEGQFKSLIETRIESCYQQLHGSLAGLDNLKAQAAASVFPPGAPELQTKAISPKMSENGGASAGPALALDANSTDRPASQFQDLKAKKLYDGPQRPRSEVVTLVWNVPHPATICLTKLADGPLLDPNKRKCNKLSGVSQVLPGIYGFAADVSCQTGFSGNVFTTTRVTLAGGFSVGAGDTVTYQVADHNHLYSEVGPGCSSDSISYGIVHWAGGFSSNGTLEVGNFRSF